MTQITGQIISPSQKIRESESDACCFPVPWWKQDILTVRTSVNTIKLADSKQAHLCTSCYARGQYHVRLKTLMWTTALTPKSSMEHAGQHLTFLDSNTQWLCPSSSTWFHHRRLTNNLPVMFWKQRKHLDMPLQWSVNLQQIFTETSTFKSC